MSDRIVKASLLRCVNDKTDVLDYDGDYLVDMPFKRVDGDAVRLLVERHNDEFRVSDRGDGLESLLDAGVNIDSGAAREAIKQIKRSVALDGLSADDYELSALVSADRVGCILNDIAIASIRIESLTALSQNRPARKFSTVISKELSGLFSEVADVKLRAPMPQTGHRTRTVTASVSLNNRTAYVQAVGRSDLEGSVAKCYYAFSRSTVPQLRRISALQGVENDWDEEQVHDLNEVSNVVFPEQSIASLDEVVRSALEPSWL